MTLTDHSSRIETSIWEEEEEIKVNSRLGEDIVISMKIRQTENCDNFLFELYRGELPIPSNRYRIEPQGNLVQLTLKETKQDDAGHYSLIAKKITQNGNQNKFTRRIHLRVDESSSGFDEGDLPIFVRRLSDLSVKVGTRTRFLVEIRSPATPKVTWHKNDQLIQANTRFSFVNEGNFYCIDVAPVTVDDEGHWTCMVENYCGRSSCSSHLTVIVPKAYKKPEFVGELRAILTETGTVSLECKVVGVPTPLLKWFKDNKEIKAGDVFALTANVDDPTSLGTYTCEATNCMGTAFSSSKVHVVGKGSREGSLRPADTLSPSGPLPIFRQILQDESCKIGESLCLSCKVEVPPWPKEITWYNKEGKVEASERYHIQADGLGGYSIVINPVEAMDEGEWKCVATSFENMKQFTTCYVAMSIPKNYRKPRFMESLKAILTEEGLVSFECKVVGFPTPLLQWFKDGQELKPGDVYQLTGANSLGSYCCIARNCMGEAKSTAELTVEDIQNQLNEEERLQLLSTNQPPKFIRGLRSCEARICDNFRFTVQVSLAPAPSLFWYRDDSQVDENDKYKIEKESLGTCHFDVQRLDFVDQAEWKCVASNDYGHSVTSCFLKLIIPKHYKQPKFLENLRAILSEEGAVNLECKVIGVPQPTLKWFKDGAELKAGDIHRIISGQDGTCCLGTYTCEASNCMGTVSSSASLLGFEDRVVTSTGNGDVTRPFSAFDHERELAHNLSLSTIHEERTSQLHDTVHTDQSVTVDDRGEVSFSFDGKEVSVSLYETPDLTEEEAIQIVEMYADQLSEHVTEHNIIELPPMRFMKETSNSGNLLMEAVVIDVSPEYFVSVEEGDDLRTEADVEDMSMMDEQATHSLSPSFPVDVSFSEGDRPPVKPPRRKSSAKSEKSDRMMIQSESYHSAREPIKSLSIEKKDSFEMDSEAFTDALSSGDSKLMKFEKNDQESSFDNGIVKKSTKKKRSLLEKTSSEESSREEFKKTKRSDSADPILTGKSDDELEKKLNNKEMLNMFQQLSEPTLIIRNALIDFDSLLQLAESSDHEQNLFITENFALPIENLFNQINHIEANALKDAGKRSMAQNVRIAVLEAMSGPTEELLRGIEVMKRREKLKVDPVILEPLVNPVDEIIAGLAKIEYEISGSSKHEKPIILERMMRTISWLGHRIEESDASSILSKPLTMIHKTLEKFVDQIPLNPVNGTWNENIDAVLIESLCLPLEDLTRISEDILSRDINMNPDVAKQIAEPFDELLTRLDALVVALEGYETDHRTEFVLALKSSLVGAAEELTTFTERTTTSFEEPVTLPEVILDPLIDVQSSVNTILRVIDDPHSEKEKDISQALGSSELIMSLTQLRQTLSNAAHTATTLKEDETINSLIDLREPLFDLQIALSSELLYEEIPIINSIIPPLNTLKKIFSTTLNHVNGIEITNSISPILETLEEIQQQVPMIIEQLISMKNEPFEIPLEVNRRKELTEILESLEIASQLSTVFFDISSILEQQERKIGKTSLNDSTLVIKLEEVRESLGSTTVALGNLPIKIDLNDDDIINELAHLSAPLINLQKELNKKHNSLEEEILKGLIKPIGEIKNIIESLAEGISKQEQVMLIVGLLGGIEENIKELQKKVIFESTIEEIEEIDSERGEESLNFSKMEHQKVNKIEDTKTSDEEIKVIQIGKEVLEFDEAKFSEAAEINEAIEIDKAVEVNKVIEVNKDTGVNEAIQLKEVVGLENIEELKEMKSNISEVHQQVAIEESKTDKANVEEIQNILKIVEIEETKEITETIKETNECNITKVEESPKFYSATEEIEFAKQEKANIVLENLPEAKNVQQFIDSARLEEATNLKGPEVLQSSTINEAKTEDMANELKELEEEFTIKEKEEDFKLVSTTSTEGQNIYNIGKIEDISQLKEETKNLEEIKQEMDILNEVKTSETQEIHISDQPKIFQMGDADEITRTEELESLDEDSISKQYANKVQEIPNTLQIAAEQTEHFEDSLLSSLKDSKDILNFKLQESEDSMKLESIAIGDMSQVIQKEEMKEVRELDQDSGLIDEYETKTERGLCSEIVSLQEAIDVTNAPLVLKMPIDEDISSLSEEVMGIDKETRDEVQLTEMIDNLETYESSKPPEVLKMAKINQEDNKLEESEEKNKIDKETLLERLEETLVPIEQSIVCEENVQSEESKKLDEATMLKSETIEIAEDIKESTESGEFAKTSATESQEADTVKVSESPKLFGVAEEIEFAKLEEVNVLSENLPEAKDVQQIVDSSASLENVNLKRPEVLQSANEAMTEDISKELKELVELKEDNKVMFNAEEKQEDIKLTAHSEAPNVYNAAKSKDLSQLEEEEAISLEEMTMEKLNEIESSETKEVLQIFDQPKVFQMENVDEISKTEDLKSIDDDSFSKQFALEIEESEKNLQIGAEQSEQFKDSLAENLENTDFKEFNLQESKEPEHTETVTLFGTPQILQKEEINEMSEADQTGIIDEIEKESGNILETNSLHETFEITGTPLVMQMAAGDDISSLTEEVASMTSEGKDDTTLHEVIEQTDVFDIMEKPEVGEAKIEESSDEKLEEASIVGETPKIELETSIPTVPKLEEGKEEPEEEPKEEPKEELKEEPKEEPKEELKKELKEEPKAESKEEPKEEPKDEPKEEPEAESKEESKEEPKEELKEEHKEELKAEPKEEPKAEFKEEPKEKPKAEPKEEPKDEPKEELKEEHKEELKAGPKEEPKAESKEEPKVIPKEEPKEEETLKPAKKELKENEERAEPSEEKKQLQKELITKLSNNLNEVKQQMINIVEEFEQRPVTTPSLSVSQLATAIEMLRRTVSNISSVVTKSAEEMKNSKIESTFNDEQLLIKLMEMLYPLVKISEALSATQECGAPELILLNKLNNPIENIKQKIVNLMIEFNSKDVEQTLTATTLAPMIKILETIEKKIPLALNEVKYKLEIVNVLHNVLRPLDVVRERMNDLDTSAERTLETDVANILVGPTNYFTRILGDIVKKFEVSNHSDECMRNAVLKLHGLIEPLFEFHSTLSMVRSSRRSSVMETELLEKRKNVILRSIEGLNDALSEIIVGIEGGNGNDDIDALFDSLITLNAAMTSVQRHVCKAEYSRRASCIGTLQTRITSSLDQLLNTVTNLQTNLDQGTFDVISNPLETLQKQLQIAQTQLNETSDQHVDEEAIVEGFIYPADRLLSSLNVLRENQQNEKCEVTKNSLCLLKFLQEAVSQFESSLTTLHKDLIDDRESQQLSNIETLGAVLVPLKNIRETIGFIIRESGQNIEQEEIKSTKNVKNEDNDQKAEDVSKEKTDGVPTVFTTVETIIDECIEISNLQTEALLEVARAIPKSEVSENQLTVVKEQTATLHDEEKAKLEEEEEKIILLNEAMILETDISEPSSSSVQQLDRKESLVAFWSLMDGPLNALKESIATIIDEQINLEETANIDEANVENENILHFEVVQQLTELQSSIAAIQQLTLSEEDNSKEITWQEESFPALQNLAKALEKLGEHLPAMEIQQAVEIEASSGMEEDTLTADKLKVLVEPLQELRESLALLVEDNVFLEQESDNILDELSPMKQEAVEKIVIEDKKKLMSEDNILHCEVQESIVDSNKDHEKEEEFESHDKEKRKQVKEEENLRQQAEQKLMKEKEEKSKEEVFSKTDQEDESIRNDEEVLKQEAELIKKEDEDFKQTDKKEEMKDEIKLIKKNEEEQLKKEEHSHNQEKTKDGDKKIKVQEELKKVEDENIEKEDEKYLQKEKELESKEEDQLKCEKEEKERLHGEQKEEHIKQKEEIKEKEECLKKDEEKKRLEEEEQHERVVEKKKKEEEECLKKELEEQNQKEEEQRLKQEVEENKQEKERLKKEKDEQLKKNQEEEERIKEESEKEKKDEEKRLKKEKEEQIKHEAEKKKKKEEERLKEEELEQKKEEERVKQEETKKKEEEVRLKKEKEEQARIKEEEEIKRYEEEERLKREQEEVERKKGEERTKQEEEERLKKEKEEHQRIIEEERLKQEEEDKEKEPLKKEKEEQERKKKEEEIKRQEEERLKKEQKEEEEIKRREEEKRIKEEKEEQRHKEEEDELKHREDEERLKKEQEEQKRIEEEVQKQREDEQRKKEAEERLKKEQEEEERKEEERIKLETEKKKKEEEERLMKEKEEQIQREAEKKKKEDEERLKKEQEELERKKNEERLKEEAEIKKKEEERIKKENEERLKKEQEELERKKEEERLKQEEETKKKEEEHLQKEKEEMEAEKKKKEDEERLRIEQAEMKKKEEERLMEEKEEQERREKEQIKLETEKKEKEEEERLKKEKEEQNQREVEEKKKEDEERLKKEEERLKKEKEELEAEEKKKEDEERLRKEQEEMKKKEEERLKEEKEEQERKEKEEEIQREAEKRQKEDEERLKKEQDELERKMEKERLKKEREEQERKIEEERLQQENENKKKEEAERLEKEREELERKKEEERFKQEAEIKKKQEEERLRKEQEEMKMKEEERLKLEEENRKKEEERLKKEKEDEIKREAEKKKKEEEERLKKEEEELERKKEEERLKKEKEEQRRKEKEEEFKREAEKKEKEEEERLKKEEEELQRKKEEERLKEEENKKKEEVERLKKEKEEQARKEKEEEIKREAEKKQKEEEKRLKKEQKELERKKEEERLKEKENKKKEEEERLKKEKEEQARKEKEEEIKREAEKKQKEEEKRLKKEQKELERKKEEERLKEKENKKKEEEERLKKEKEEQALKEKEERLRLEEENKKQEEDRLKKEKEEEIQRQAEKKQKEEGERLKKEREEQERLKQEAENKKEEERLRIEKEEQERTEKEERIKHDVKKKKKEEEKERLKKEKEEQDRKNEEERLQLEAENVKHEEESLIKEKEEKQLEKESEKKSQEEGELSKKDKVERNDEKQQECATKNKKKVQKEDLKNGKEQECKEEAAEEKDQSKVEEPKKVKRKKSLKQSKIETNSKVEGESLKTENSEQNGSQVLIKSKTDKDSEISNVTDTEKSKQKLRRHSKQLDQEKEVISSKKVEKSQTENGSESKTSKISTKDIRRRSSIKSSSFVDDSQDSGSRKQKLDKSKGTDDYESKRLFEYKSDDSSLLTLSQEHKSSVRDRIRKETESYSKADITDSSVTNTEYSSKITSRKSREDYLTPLESSHQRNKSYDRELSRSSKYYESSVSSSTSFLRPTERSMYLSPTIHYSRRRPGSISPSLIPEIDTSAYYLSTERSCTPERSSIDRAKCPFFCTKLTNRTVADGSRLRLTCTVIGQPDPDVHWTKNGEKLRPGSRERIKLENGLATLEINSVLPEDSGCYVCVAKNSHGQSSSEACVRVYAAFEAIPLPPTFTSSIKDTYRFADHELILECRVRGQPTPTVTWLKDDIVLRGSRYSQSFVGDGICRLKIANPDSSDSGEYVCRADNDVRTDQIRHVVHFEGHEQRFTSARERILFDDRNRTPCREIARRPRFSNYLLDHSVPVGGTIALQVEVGGTPAPNVTWLRRDNERRERILSSKFRTFNESGVHTLILPEASESEAGTYICRASNAFGQTDTIANVEVLGPTKFDANGKPAMFISRPAEKTISAVVGEDVSVSFRVAGVPKPRVTWMKGIRDITNGPRSCKDNIDDYVRITLSRINPSDEGTYCILAKNRYGCDRAFFSIKVKQRARSLTPTILGDTGNLLQEHENEETPLFIKDFPGPISSEPILLDSGRNWLSLSWGKAEQKGPAPIVGYKIEAWLLGGEGGARWMTLGESPINSFDAFNLRSGGEYKFRITPRNRYGWGESLVSKEIYTISDNVEIPEFVKILPGQIKALEGSTVKLECEVRGDSKIDWYRENNGINPNDDPRCTIIHSGTKYSLIISKIKETDSGRYICKASNKAGKVSTFARVIIVNDEKILKADEKLKSRYFDGATVESPPQFAMRLRDRRVQTSYPFRLTCQVLGYPEPQVTWFKNGKEIREDGFHAFWNESHFHTLEISSSSVEDSGCYMATAKNLYGSVSCRCMIVVDKGIRAYIAPEFTCGLDAAYTLKPGEELRMSAQIEAYPSVGVVWHRDGVRLRPSRRAVMTLNHDGGVELCLGNITSRDAGIYSCTAINEIGRAETSTRVTVDADLLHESSAMMESNPEVPYSQKPLFVTKPLSTDAVEGDTIIIMCEVVGDPKPEVMWLRDFLKPDYYRDATHFRRIGAGPQYRLEIPFAKLDFTGTYSVIAKNCHGEAKAIISLQIYAKGQGKGDRMDHQSSIREGKILSLPIIRKELRDIQCCDGDAVTLECKFYAPSETPIIRWEKDGKTLSLTGDFSADFDGETAKLSIQHVYQEDEGEYTCTASNQLGKAFTSACLIVDVPEGKENVLSQPRLTKPMGLLSAGSTPRSTPRSTPVRSLSPADGRELRAINLPRRVEAGVNMRKKPKVAPPKFYTVPHNRVAEEGETIRFQCAITGHPMPWVIWDKNGVPITQTPRIVIKEKDDLRVLEISQVTSEDAGLYRVTLENDVGRTEASARLEIINRHSAVPRPIRTRSASPRTYPTFTRSLLGCATRVNDSFQLQCDIRSSPSPTPSWYRNGKRIERSSRIRKHFDGRTARIDILEVKKSDSGEYVCEAYNFLGSTRSSCQVIVFDSEDVSTLDKEAPKFLQTLSKESIVMEGHSYELQTRITGTPPFEIKWLKDKKEVCDTDCYRYVVYEDGGVALRLANVNSFDAGEYTCLVRNAFGSSSCNGLFAVQDYNGGSKAAFWFTKTPVPVLASKGEIVSFCARIQSRRSIEIEWTVNGISARENHRCKVEKDGPTTILRINSVTYRDCGEIRCTASVTGGRGPSISCATDLRFFRLPRSGDRSPSPVKMFLSPLLTRRSTRVSPSSYRHENKENLNRITSNFENSENSLTKKSPINLKVEIKNQKKTEKEEKLCRNNVKRMRKKERKVENEEKKRLINEVIKGDKKEMKVKRNGIQKEETKWEVVGEEENELKKDKQLTKEEIKIQKYLQKFGDDGEKEVKIEKDENKEEISLEKIENKFELKKEGKIIEDSKKEQEDRKKNKDVNKCKNTRIKKENFLETIRKNEIVKPANEQVMPEILDTKRFFPTHESVNGEELEFLEAYEHDEPAIVLKDPLDVIALRGSTAILSVSYRGQPEPTVRWLQAGRVLVPSERIQIETGSGKSRLTLEKITADQAGKYAVFVENSLGSDCRYSSLAVEGPPESPSGVPIVSGCNVGNEIPGVNVAWCSPSYDGGCALTGYAIEMRHIDEENWTLVSETYHSLNHTIAGLIPDETYLFRVRAINIHGASEPSFESVPFTVRREIENEKEMKDQMSDKEIEEESFCEKNMEKTIVTTEDGKIFPDRYEVMEELGKGRYGIVKRVVEKSTGREFASKFVKTIKATDKKLVREEINIMNLLKHPKLLRLSAAFESPREIIMITEYISGGELFERVVADDFTLTEKDSILFMRQICEGVKYMHKNNVVHLDLKPENIMCRTRTSHSIKLIDFGLAQILKPNVPIRVLFGTPEFIPPEIISYEPIGTESDMWSMGIICYVLLSGLSPFMGNNDTETFANITRAEYDFDDEAFDAISQDAKDFIGCLLIKRKESRMSAKECLEHSWLAQHTENMSQVALSTEKLKKFLVRRKWQKTGNALRALGRMSKSANSRRSPSQSSGSSSPVLKESLSFESNSSDKQNTSTRENSFEDNFDIVDNKDSLRKEEMQGEEKILETIEISSFVAKSTEEAIEEVSSLPTEEEEVFSPLAESIENVSLILESNYENISNTSSNNEEIIEPKYKEILPEEFHQNILDNTSRIDEVIEENSEFHESKSEEEEEEKIQELDSENNLDIKEIIEENYSKLSEEIVPEENEKIELEENEAIKSQLKEANNEKQKYQVRFSIDVKSDETDCVSNFNFDQLKSTKKTDDNQNKIDKQEIEKNKFYRNNDIKNGVCTTVCDLNTLHEDDSGENTRVIKTSQGRHYLHTGNVSRTAKIFEKKGTESHAGSSVKENPTRPLSRTHTQRERIQKAFDFWNK
ncbi:titin homolog isoform X2 [Leptopilina boulardi]|uniref:titin homolog isoform X2 n=1 Tax=Leptopilina boulardi TaxID=63433 RepID=UPI0021F69031|nr:titin homolog isoform X2 [Leptopilina boulardi]